MEKINAKKTHHKAWIVTVDMGYGHQRATHPLKDIAYNDEIIIANNYKGIPDKDRTLWKRSRGIYEAISRAKTIPLIGDYIFNLLDSLQNITPFYPRRDLSRPNLPLSQTYRIIEKSGLGKDLIDRLKKTKLPFVTSFYLPAFAAEVYKYPEEIFCIICDADISRGWASKNPKKSRINYLAPNKRVVERLKLYGVNPKRIFLTGFPLPKENLGGHNLSVLKSDLGHRICNLDPKRVFIKKYKHILKYYLGEKHFPRRSDHPLTLTFAVGGAGAQRELGIQIAKSLTNKIKEGKIRLNLIAGSRYDVYEDFTKGLMELDLIGELNKNIQVVYAEKKEDYFDLFNKALRTTDILWTKPSELTFYTGLGLPIIMAPPIGSQEIFNRKWLVSIGSGLTQNNPKYTNEWLFDWIESGWLAEAAMQGYMDAIKRGVYTIEDVVLAEKGEAEKFAHIF